MIKNKNFSTAKKIILTVISFLTFGLTVSGVNAAWNIYVPGDLVSNGTTQASAPVAYLAGSKTKYYSIESAVAAANKSSTANDKKVVVIPSATDNVTNEVVIKKSFTINSGTTLLFPFSESYLNTELNSKNKPSGDDYFAYFKSDSIDNNITNEYYFADYNDEYIKQYCKLNVVLNDNVEITIENGGRFFIGSVCGSFPNGDGVMTSVSGNYAQLTMNSNSKIINNGELQCYGYIKENINNNGSIIENTGTIIEPFVLIDWWGGSDFAGCLKGPICPFDQYDLLNIRSTIKFTKNGQLKVIVNIRIDAKLAKVHSAFDYYSDSLVTFIASSEAFFNTGGNSDIYLKYTPQDPRYTKREIEYRINSICKITLNGNITTGTISGGVNAIVMNLKFNSKDFPLSVPNNYYVINNGTLNIQSELKFYPGAIIENNGTIAIEKPLILYTNLDFAQKEYGKKVKTYINNKGLKAKLYNGGILKINSSFGGIIEPKDQEESQIITQNNFSNTSQVKQGYGKKKNAVSVIYQKGSPENHSEQGVTRINSINNLTSIEKNKTYNCSGNGYYVI